MTVKEKENKTPILSIEFSSKGKILAISYGLLNLKLDTARTNKDLLDSKLDKEIAYISIFMNRASHQSSLYRTNEKNIYIKYTDIKIPSVYETYQTDSKFEISIIIQCLWSCGKLHDLFIR